MTLHDVERVARSIPVAMPPTRTRFTPSTTPASHDPAPKVPHIPHRTPRVPWHRSYRRAVLAADALVLFLAVALAEVIRFGLEPTMPAGTNITYTVLGVGIAVGWWLMLQLYRATDERILGHGPDEYRKVVQASVMGFGVLAIATLLLKQDLSRGYLAIAFPVGLVGLLFGRKALRTWLARRRWRGTMSTNVLVIGGTRSAESIDRYFARHPEAGFRMTGVWIPDEPEARHPWLDVPGRFVPVLGNARSLVEAVRLADAGAVFVTDTEHLGPNGLKDLTWELQTLEVDLMVSPNVVDVSTPRITLSNVGAMPFLHLEKPQYEGATRWGKVVFDRTFAGAAVLALTPILIAAAIAVKVSSAGPVLYRSERIGVGGVPFEMLKFRSMVVDAEEIKQQLTSDTGGVLFKMKDDPRVTRVGRVLRRFSIDELPQLLNVLRGDMSIVGPRPPLRSEVEAYDEGVGRRLLVKQGITGLWQVSGRSDLSWDDTVRLDLDYVENWSLMRDVQIIWRTLRAVVRSDGAY
jgi:exopolysaccharide biosynthesis polyprenyl glycosylphosphotransferase